MLVVTDCHCAQKEKGFCRTRKGQLCLGLLYGPALGYDFPLEGPEGQAMTSKDSMSYLGTTLWADGRVKSELGKKLGAAWSDFQFLAQLWKHTAVTKQRKLQIFQAVITSKLLYGLSSAWLNVCEERRLNGFQARCLRGIVGIKPAFISRVSNKIVLQRASQSSYTKQLRLQLKLFGRIARAPDNDVIRKLTFCPNSLRAATDRYIRKAGRPRNEWATMLFQDVARLSCSHGFACAHDFVQDEAAYEFAIIRDCSRS